MAFTPLDESRLRQALDLAATAIGVSDPNPRVGCLIGRADGTLLGRGATRQAGGPHAEIVALADARAAGHDPRGATAWVTLEPCAHHGRTPPCCDALIEAGLARVVIAIGDPFPQVNGEGIARLRAAGIEVHMAPPELAAAAREINIGFFSRVLRGRPWVRVKVAASLDGYTALENGRSQWITGEAARTDGHGWRRRAGAVLSGIGTVLADDPRLDVRLVPTVMQPLRVIVDSSLRLSPSARLLAPPGRVLVVTARANRNGAAKLEALGAEILVCAGAEGRVDLPALLAQLAARGINELHVEAGPTLNGALLEQHLADELLLYIAPRWLGRGRPMADRAGLRSLDDAEAWQFVDATRVGTDLRLRTIAQDPSTWIPAPPPATSTCRSR